MSVTTILTYIIWNINPDAFLIPFLDRPVRWYGISWALALFISQQVMAFIYKREGCPLKETETMTIYLVIGTLIGARLGHILFYDPLYYFQNPLKVFAIWEGGLASHGGSIGLMVAAYVFARKTKVNYLWLLDRLAIIAALTACFIRLGNLMNSEMVGIPTNLPWGFIFTLVDNIPRHPAQLYEAIYCFFLFLLSLGVWYTRKDRMKNGFILGWFLILLFSLRFIDEFFKINQESFEDNLILNMGQLLSIPFIVAGILILLLNTRKQTMTTSPDKVLVEEK